MSCPACFQGVERTDATPTGVEVKLHGLHCYVASPASDRKPKGIVVIVPDAFGWKLVNNRLLADEYARQGEFQVYLPDFMNGHASPIWVLGELDSATRDFSLTGWLTKPYHLAAAVYGFGPFVYRNRLSVTMPRVTAFLAGLRSHETTQGIPIGVAGFCWGGQHVLRLCWDAPEPSPATDTPLHTLIDAAFTAHPSGIEIPKEVEKVRKPLAIAAGDQDHVMPIAKMHQAKDVLVRNGIKHELEVYEGAGHGWSVRIDRTNPKQNEQAQACEAQAVRWFSECFAEVGTK